MTRVAVLGASGAASLLATILAEDPEVAEVSRGPLASPDAALAGAAVAVTAGPSDPASEKAAALACARLGIPYVSTSGSVDVVRTLQELNRRLEGESCLVVAGMSWSPGTSNLMAALAGIDWDGTDRVDISWSASSTGPMGTVALALGAERLHGSAYRVADGALRAERAGSGPRPVFFPEPLGWKKVRIARNAEVLMLDRQRLGSIVVRGTLTSAAADRAVRLVPENDGSNGELPGKVKAAGLAGKLVPGGPWSGLRVDAAGVKEGAQVRASLGLVDQLPNLLVNPALVAVKLLRRTRPAVAGVVSPEAIFDPSEFFAELGAKGVRIARLERTG